MGKRDRHHRWIRLTALLIAAGVVLLSGCSIRAAFRPEVYQVARGDTLYSIAWEHGIPWQRLASWNQIPAPYTIYPGQILSLDPYLPPAYLPSARGAATRDEDAGGDREMDHHPQAEPAARAQVTVAPSAPPAVGVEQPAPPPAGASAIGWRWPAQGPVVHDYDPDQARHGIDIGGHRGDPVLAAGDGAVVYSGSGLKGYGNLIIIKHSRHYLSAYGFNRRLLVTQGEQVHAGQRIAVMGVGPQRQPMLHFEVRRDGTPVDPKRVLPAR
ncbi:MAG: peptidoglycan DD-metalloendopeptidase family protein [Salinisphaera sp.]|nr:peptidoglycan DD-metalloendopeptidase family protein [Salinisphaera sp.]